MKYEEHCIECETILGKPFVYVHLWLDAFAHDEKLSLWERTKHRKFRHNQKGIESIKKMYGDEGGKAAELHIISDLKTDGNWNESEGIPKNTEDYIKKGLW
jgi:hypothetical protein